MSRYIVNYVLFFILGAIVAQLLSSLIHYSLDKPRGVPLPRLGLAGTITQIGLMVFPFVFAPIPLGRSFLGEQKRRPNRKECRRLALNIGFLSFVIWLVIFAASGIWFGIIQGGALILFGALLGPALFASVTLWALFPLASRFFEMLQTR